MIVVLGAIGAAVLCGVVVMVVLTSDSFAG